MLYVQQNKTHMKTTILFRYAPRYLTKFMSNAFLNILLQVVYIYSYVYFKWTSTKLRWKDRLKKLESSKHETSLESLLIHMWPYVDIPDWRPHKGLVPNLLHAPHNGCNSLQTLYKRFQNWKHYEKLFQSI
jgi:hypothetical protein